MGLFFKTLRRVFARINSMQFIVKVAVMHILMNWQFVGAVCNDITVDSIRFDSCK